MLRAHHVVVGVLRKPRVQAVARLARLAVADAVRQDDEISRGVEQLARPEQLAAEGLREKPAPVPPVPCRISTAFRTTPDASRRGVPSVR